MSILPHYEKAIIPIEKFTEYALNADRDPNKTFAFKSALGYTENNVGDLVNNINSNISNFNAVSKGNNGFGEVYECVMSLKGANGKTANILTSWIIRNNEDFPRLTNAYVTNKKVR